jgi:hypothetical protein
MPPHKPGPSHEPGSPHRNPVRRRAILAAGVATATAGLLTGCRVPQLLTGDRSGGISTADLAALRSVASESLQLATRYDSAIGSAAGDQAAVFTAIRGAHREHHAAIIRALEDNSVTTTATPAASPSASGSGSTAKDLAAAERSAADRASAACVQVAATHAPLVGTIAAARASHAEALS